MNLSLARLATLTLAGVFLNAAFPHATSAAGVLAAGEGSAAAITASGRLATWGANDAGQLGHSPGEKVVPLPGSVGGVSSWTKVAAGGRFTLGLGGDGRLYAWGDNSSGQLGSGSAVAATATPVLVALPTGAVVRDFVAGQSHALVLVDLPGGDTGALYSWGGNFFGQLGLAVGDFSTRSTPARVTAGGLRFRQIAATYASSFAIAQDGSLWAWGSNSRGELGQGKRITAANLRSSVPVRVGKALNWTSLAGGSFHVLALGGGRVYAWGANDFGQCAGSGKGQVLAPAALTLKRAKGQPVFTVTALSAGNTHSLALVSSGHVYAWGLNQSGKLGRAPAASGRNVTATPTIIDQDDPASADPRRRIALPAATAIAAGGDFTLLALASGDYLAFGSNLQGQLGIGSTDTTSVGSGASRAPLLNVANLAVAAPGPVSANVVGTVPQFGVGGTFGPLSLPVRNAGFVSHTTGYRVAIYLSANDTLDSSDRLLVSKIETATLAAGELRVTSIPAADLTTPQVTPGPYFLISQVLSFDVHGSVVPDAYSGDNSTSTAVAVVGPDLALSKAINVDRKLGGLDGFGNISIMMVNAGLGVVPAGRTFLAEAYLSADESLQPGGDILLKAMPISVPEGGLVAGAAMMIDFGAVTVPENVNGGDYTLIVVVNREGTVRESGPIGQGGELQQTGANLRALPVRVATHDLSVTEPVIPATPLFAGTKLANVAVTVKNLGTRDYPGAYTVELYSSDSETFDYTATLVGQQVVEAGLAAQTSRVVTFAEITLPGAFNGSVSFFARVVPDPEIGDRYPANNLASVRRVVGFDSANLAVSAPDPVSATVVDGLRQFGVGTSFGPLSLVARNNSRFDHTKRYRVSLYLSGDGRLDANDRLLVTKTEVATLAAGQLRSTVFSAAELAIPYVTPGVYSLLSQVVSLDAEGNPTPDAYGPDNGAAISLGVTGSDLALGATIAVGRKLVDVSDSGFGNVSIGASNGGLGTIAAGTAFLAEAYLSADESLQPGGDILLKAMPISVPEGGLVAGAAMMIDFGAVTVPENVNGGDYTLIVVVNREGTVRESGPIGQGGELQQTGANLRALPVRVATHDLSVTEPVIPATPLFAGTKLANVAVTVKNLGTRDYPGAYTVELYSSDSETFDYTATLVGQQVVEAGLAAQTSRVVTFAEITLPGAFNGSVSFFARVVPDPEIGDRYPANNLASVRRVVGFDSANLAVSAPDPVSATVVDGLRQFGVGTSFGPLSLVARNNSRFDHTKRYRVSLYLSGDGRLDANDRLLVTKTEVATLAAGQLRSTVFSAAELAIPYVTPGVYSLLSQVVSLDAEGNPTPDAYGPDNGAAISLGVTGSDLALGATIAVGRKLVDVSDSGFGNVSIGASNGGLGTIAAGTAFLAEAYLSADESLQPGGDILLKAMPISVPEGGLVAGAAMMIDFGAVTVPENVNGGDYTLIVVVNREGTVRESGPIGQGGELQQTGANLRALPVRVATHDLSVRLPVLPTAELGSGTTIPNISLIVQNLGARDYSGAYTVELYTSGNSTFDFTATKVGQQVVYDGLAAQGSHSVVFPSVSLPITQNGNVTFFSRVVADPALGDRFPANNLASVTRTVGKARFTLSDIVLPNTASVESGASLGAVGYRLSNGGPGGLPQGYPVSVEVYLSADDTLDRNTDIRLDRYSYPDGLGAGQSVTLPGSARNLTIPAGTPNGFYYLIIAVNADGGQADLPSVATTALVNVGALALSVTVPEVATSALGANGTVPSVSFGINNRSGFSVPAGLGVELYLSKDAIFDNGDFPLASTTLANTIAGNTLRAIDFKDVLLPDLGQGSYYLFSRIVLPAGVLDTDPSDNVAATEVTLSRAQLAIEGFRPPVYLDLEQPSPALQRLSFTLVNLSPGVIPSDKTLSYEIFLSRDENYDSRDTLLYTGRLTGGLAGLGRVTTPNFDLAIDPNLIGGTYKLLLIVNRDGVASLGSAEPVIARAEVKFKKPNAPELGLDYGVFTLSQPQSWTTVADSRATGGTAFQAQGQSATLSLMVTGPTEIRAPWKLSPGAGDSISYRIDGVEQNSLGSFEPVYRLPGVGTTPIRVPASHDPQDPQLSVEFVYKQSSDDPAAYARVDLDVPAFASSGDGDWFAVNAGDAKVNDNYTRTPQLAVGQQASLSVQVEGPALVSFWWRAPGDATDTLEFAIDGQTAILPTSLFSEELINKETSPELAAKATPRQARISNQPDWRRVFFLIGDGPRTLTWTYKQNSLNTVSQGNIDGLVVLNPVPDAATLKSFDSVGYADLPDSTVDLGITSAVANEGTYLLDDANRTSRLPLHVAFTNLGTAFAATPVWSSSNLEVRLSTDQVWGGEDDISLGNFARFQALQVGDEVTFDAELNLSLDIPQGSYYLMVRVRAFDQGGEFTLANNTVILGGSGGAGGGGTGGGGGFIIRRAPNLVISNFAGLERYFPYHPEDAVYLTYDIANTGLSDVLPTDRFKVRLTMFAIRASASDLTIPSASDLTKGEFIRSFPDRELSVFLPAPGATTYPSSSSVSITHFLDLPSERDLLVALQYIPSGTLEDDASVAASREMLRGWLFYFNVTVDADNQVAESSETNTFWLDQRFNVVPVPDLETAGLFYGDAAFGPLVDRNLGAFMNGLFDPNAVPPISGTFTDFIWDYALFRASSGTPNLLFQEAAQNGSSILTVPPYGPALFNTLTFDFNIRASDVEIVVEAGDDTKGWGPVLTLKPPYNMPYYERSLSGYGGLSSSPYVTAIEGNATDVQKTYAARITVRDNLPLSQRGPNPGMRLKVRPVAGISVATPSTLTGSQVDSTIVLNWSGSLPSNSFGIQGAWIVERTRSLDGRFEIIGSTKSNTFTDNYPGSKGTNTYRIRGLTSAGASATVQADVTLR